VTPRTGPQATAPASRRGRRPPGPGPDAPLGIRAVPAAGLIVLLLAVVAGNAWLSGRLRGTGTALAPASPLGETIVDSARLDSGSLLVATADNDVLILDGDAITRRVSVAAPILSVAVSADSRRAYVGCTDQRVYLLDADLAPAGSFPVSGRVKDMHVNEGGQLLVVYGTGEYSDRWYLGRFSASGDLLRETKIGYNSKAVTSVGDAAYFGTRDSRIGRIEADGREAWRITLEKPVESLVAVRRAGRLLASDESGGVWACDLDGRLLWSAKLGPYAVRALAWDDAGSHVVAGDESGRVYVLSEAGAVLFSAKPFEDGVRLAHVGAGGEVRLGSVSGTTATLALEAARQGQLARTLGRLRIWLDVAGAVAAGILIVLAIPPLLSRARRAGKAIRRGRLGYLLVLPSLALLFAFRYYPAFTAIYYSFTNFSLSNPLELIGLENYARLFHDEYFLYGFRNMLILLATSILKTTTFPLLAALLVFSLASERSRYWYKTAFILPSIVPGMVTVMVWRMIYSADVGLLNQTLEALGLGAFRQAWLGNAKYALGSIIMAGFPWIGAFAFLIYFGGLINISKELYDAAKIDGASVLTRLRRIELPLLKPQFRILLFFSYVGSIQSYAGIYVYTRGGPGVATYVPGLHMYLTIADESNYGYASALGVVLFVVVLAGTILNFRFNRKVSA
jgi:ABC-type sugar transport system permease subunit